MVTDRQTGMTDEQIKAEKYDFGGRMACPFCDTMKLRTRIGDHIVSHHWTKLIDTLREQTDVLVE